MVTVAIKLKDATPWKKSYDQLRQHIKNQSCHFANKGPTDMSLSKVQKMVKDREAWHAAVHGLAKTWI